MKKIDSATESLFREMYNKVLRYAKSVCRNINDAEDMTQETLMRAYKYLDTFNTRASFETWVMAIARNQHIDSIRRANRRVQMVSPEDIGYPEFLSQCPDHSPNPEQEFDMNTLDPVLADSILELPTQEKRLLEMIAVDGMSFAEVARELKTTAPRIRTKYRDTLNTVRASVRMKRHHARAEALVHLKTQGLPA